MFAFVMLWAYFSVSQLLIIWSANLPEEVPFYLERLHGAWAPVSIALLLAAVRAAVPAPALARASSAIRAKVKWIALVILVMRVVDITWTIGPVFRHEGSSLHWLDFAMVLGMGGAVAAALLAEPRGAAARAGARPVFQGSDGSWRTLITQPRPLPVEGDGVSYTGIVWFIVILVGTVVFCQVFVWGMFVFMESRVVEVRRRARAAGGGAHGADDRRTARSWTWRRRPSPRAGAARE